MKLSQIKIDRRLCGAFICYLKRNGYICTNNKNKQQPYFICHSETPELTHIIELDQYNNWIVPETLKQAVFEFSTISNNHSCIEICTNCKEPYHIVDHEFICPKCNEPYIPF